MDLAIAIAGAVVAVLAFAYVIYLLSRRKEEPARSSSMPESPRPSLDSLPIDDEPEPTQMGMIPSIAREEDEEKGLVFEEEPEYQGPEAEDEGAESEHTGPQPLILVTAIARTDMGRERKNNEDALLAMPEANVYGVADGMGGYAGGEVASRIAVETVQRAFITHEFPGMRRRTAYRRANELVRAIEMANDAILAQATLTPEHADMGTTVAFTRFSPSKRRVYVANVGDSRVYRIRQGQLEQLTTDHTLEREAGIKGKLGTHLSRAVGVRARVKTDVRVDEACPGDYYLVCSDGLNKMVKDQEIRDIVIGSPLERAAQRLVARANESGGIDNITVVLIRVDDARVSRA